MQACLAGIAFDASLLFVDEMPICLLVPVVWFFCVSYRHSPCNRPTASPLAILCACAYSVSCLIVPFSLFVFYQKKKIHLVSSFSSQILSVLGKRNEGKTGMQEERKQGTEEEAKEVPRSYEDTLRVNLNL